MGWHHHLSNLVARSAFEHRVMNVCECLNVWWKFCGIQHVAYAYIIFRTRVVSTSTELAFYRIWIINGCHNLICATWNDYHQQINGHKNVNNILIRSLLVTRKNISSVWFRNPINSLQLISLSLTPKTMEDFLCFYHSNVHTKHSISRRIMIIAIP